MRRLASIRTDCGQALAEFALIAPLLVILIFGIVDTARAYNAWVTIQGAAREGARYGVTGRATCSASSPSRVNCIAHVAERHAETLTNSATTLDVSLRSWDYPAYSGSAAEGDPGDQCDALEVQVEYDFEPATPIISSLIGGVHMTAKERMVNEPFGPCTS
jgi:Flp pilus assembly protein TadG